jgi:hypothetical protein
VSGQPLQMSRKLPGIGERERLVRRAKLLAWLGVGWHGVEAARSEGQQNMLCAYLSAALLVGLGANALFGQWWADPVTALLIAGVAVKEGRESWRGESCCTAPVVTGENCEEDCCR